MTRPACVNVETISLKQGATFRPVVWCWKRKGNIDPRICAACEYYKAKEEAKEKA
jgi:hypothetical protein